MKYHILNLIFLTTFLFPRPPEDWCLVLQTNTFGVFQGVATVDGMPAEEGDWIGAVDSEGNCAGAGAVTMDGGNAYINFNIYGDYNLTPDVDEGMHTGEKFVLRFWDRSEDEIYVYNESFDCWKPSNGAPMDDCGDAENIYNFTRNGPNWSATITANADTLTYPLVFGFSPDATDGYDEGIDQYAPPAPPQGTFDAALNWNNDRYYTQILNGSSDDLVEHQYTINLSYPTNNTINITWDNTGWSDMMSTCLLQDAFGGIMINVDMLSETTLTLTNPAFANLTLKVTPIDFQPSNTAPSFTGGGNVTITEDAGEYNAEWATEIIPGPASEYGQTLTFTLTTNNDDLFSSVPSIGNIGSFYPAEGDLIFATGDDLFGAATVTVVLSDDGGTEDGGVDTSEPIEFTLRVNSVNDPPSMTHPTDTTSILMGSGPVTIEGWATNISPGPANESDQVVTADPASSSNASGYFVSMPVLDVGTGNLSFEFESDANVIGNMLLKLTDDGLSLIHI